MPENDETTTTTSTTNSNDGQIELDVERVYDSDIDDVKPSTEDDELDKWSPELLDNSENENKVSGDIDNIEVIQ